jgi:hypothetical protein
MLKYCVYGTNHQLILGDEYRSNHERNITKNIQVEQMAVRFFYPKVLCLRAYQRLQAANFFPNYGSKSCLARKKLNLFRSIRKI